MCIRLDSHNGTEPKCALVEGLAEVGLYIQSARFRSHYQNDKAYSQHTGKDALVDRPEEPFARRLIDMPGISTNVLSGLPIKVKMALLHLCHWSNSCRDLVMSRRRGSLVVCHGQITK